MQQPTPAQILAAQHQQAAFRRQQAQIQAQYVPPPIEMDEIPAPTFDQVLVEQIQSYTGQLQIPDTIRDQSQHAEVIAVGPGAWYANQFQKAPCEVGDRIFFLPGNGVPLNMGTRKLYLMQANSVLGIFPKKVKIAIDVPASHLVPTMAAQKTPYESTVDAQRAIDEASEEPKAE